MASGFSISEFFFSCLRILNGSLRIDEKARASSPSSSQTVINSWRVCAAADGRGLLVYFDPYLEDLQLRLLTGPERADRLTSPLSVSGLDEDEVQLDLDYDSTHKELNGS